MNRTIELLTTDLRYLINDLGRDGGLIGPSVYDTAQVLRMSPPTQGAEQALNWLLDQQQPDGGWGDPVVPRARDVPTLAAVLALHAHNTSERIQHAIEAGIGFLWRQADIWRGPLSDDLPVAVELLLPCLLDEAAHLGIDVPVEPYAALIKLGTKRRRMIAALSPQAGTPPVHSWEAWGTEPNPALLDDSGGIGHSPAATAAWLRAAAGREDLADAYARAQRYLELASSATGLGIPGVVPTVWPINRFEQSFGLYMLLIAGLLDMPELQEVVQPCIADLAAALHSRGIGMSDSFIPDGDDTAAAISVLCAAGYDVSLASLRHFENGGHFFAYPGELQPSLSVIAHALHAYTLFDQHKPQAYSYITEHQFADGRWPGDKWNGSWLYTTSQIVIALHAHDDRTAIWRAVDTILAHQNGDGGWGEHGSTTEETAYGILALRALQRDGLLNEQARLALHRAEQWMLNDYRPFSTSKLNCWLGKELYRPHRLARIIELSATYPCAYVERSV